MTPVGHEPPRACQVLESCVYAADLDAAERFYTSVLGLERITRVEGRHVFFRCGRGVFLVFNPEQTEHGTGGIPPHGARGPGHVAFAAREAELGAWRERLRETGTGIEAETEWPGGGRSLYFRDPAGNSVELATPRVWSLSEDEVLPPR